jgi:hypothetical protein
MTLDQKCREAQPRVLAEFVRTTRRAYDRTRSLGIRRAHATALRVYRERGLSPLAA